jgi:hypothetical protein
MFTQKDTAFLKEIFSMARVHIVNNAPNEREMLQNIMNFELIVGGKMMKANEELGFTEELKNVKVPEGEGEMHKDKPAGENEDVPEEVEEENTAADPGGTD